MIINNYSDSFLINLRKPGQTDYTLPTGFLFNKISCPNLFGEMIEWIGFALMAQHLPALSFAVWTICNSRLSKKQKSSDTIFSLIFIIILLTTKALKKLKV